MQGNNLFLAFPRGKEAFVPQPQKYTTNCLGKQLNVYDREIRPSLSKVLMQLHKLNMRKSGHPFVWKIIEIKHLRRKNDCVSFTEQEASCLLYVDPSPSGELGTIENSASSWIHHKSYLSLPCTQTSHHWWRQWLDTPLLTW